MKTPEPDAWQRTSPFAVLFFFARVVRSVTRNAYQSLAPLAAFFVAYQGTLGDKLVIAATVFVAITVTVAILSYWFFRFQVRDDSIRIRQGVIRKNQRDIRFDRIQGINTEQNVFYRPLNLVTVKFDTAGSAGSEGDLPAVSRGFADSLQRRINREQELATDRAEAETPARGLPEPLFRLCWPDMIRIGLADRRALVVLAIVGPLVERLGDEAETVIANYLENAAQSALQFGTLGAWVIGIGVVAALVLALALGSIAAAFLRYHDFELRLDGTVLRSTGGLMTRHEHALAKSKVQTVRLEQGILLCWLRRYRLTLRQATSGRAQQDGARIFVVPLVTEEAGEALGHRLLAPEDDGLTLVPTSERFRPVSVHYMRSRILFGGLLPAALLCAVFWPEFGTASLVFLLWLPVAMLLAYRSWRRSAYLLGRHGLVRRSGVFGYRTVALLYRKVQRITVIQSRYQRRRGLASLRIYLASGSVRVPYIDVAMAEKLRDFILYRVESSRQAWF